MKTFLKIILLLTMIVNLLFLTGCQKDSTADKIATIEGWVYYDAVDDGHKLADATVRLIGYSISTTTDVDGHFTIEIELDEKDQEETVTLEITKDGFVGKILQNVSIKAGELTTLGHGDIILELLGSEYAGLAVIHGFLFGETVAPGNQLENVAVTVSNGNDQTVFSQSNGNFYFIYDFGDSLVDQRVFVIFNKANYNENYRRMTISPGSAYDLGDIVMEPTASSTDNTAFIEGTVYRNAISPDSTLENVTVTFQGAEETPVFTTTDGTFSFEYPLSEGVITKEISVTFERLGFERHVETGVQLTANETTQVGNIVLNSTTDTVSAAGEPYAIQIGDIESYHIYVSESGLPEVTSIQVVVSDVRGQIIDDLHRVMIHFEIVGHPGVLGTDEAPTIYPDSAETVNGVATTYVQAGTKAGAVQIRAYFTREDGYSAQVYPIQIAIWGGLPVKENFGLAAATYNIAGMLWYLTDDITAYMGDRYHNPVAPGTVVYFTSDYSYIEGSANSDNLGMATATLVSGENRPYPYMDPDSAIVRIFTHTYNQYYEQVRDTTRLIYSSIATVSVDHYSFTYNESDPSEAFTFTVQDIFTNPLTPDTKISVTPSEGTVSGAVSFEMNDTAPYYSSGLGRFTIPRGAGVTEFSFIWNAPQIEIGDEWPTSVGITISVESPDPGNGEVATYISGTYVTVP